MGNHPLKPSHELHALCQQQLSLRRLWSSKSNTLHAPALRSALQRNPLNPREVRHLTALVLLAKQMQLLYFDSEKIN